MIVQRFAFSILFSIKTLCNCKACLVKLNPRYSLFFSQQTLVLHQTFVWCNVMRD